MTCLRKALMAAPSTNVTNATMTGILLVFVEQLNGAALFHEPCWYGYKKLFRSLLRQTLWLHWNWGAFDYSQQHRAARQKVDACTFKLLKSGDFIYLVFFIFQQCMCFGKQYQRQVKEGLHHHPNKRTKQHIKIHTHKTKEL